MATQWVSRYTDAATNSTSAEPYAYPAYDRYNTGYNEAAVLVDADFLAPALLNVPVSIRSFYGLQFVREKTPSSAVAERTFPTACRLAG